MKNNNIIRNCDKCHNEDSINAVTGLCPSCEGKEKTEYFELLQKENEEIREDIYKILNDFLMSDERDDVIHKVNLLIENEIKQEQECGE